MIIGKLLLPKFSVGIPNDRDGNDDADCMDLFDKFLVLLLCVLTFLVITGLLTVELSD